MLVPLHKTGNNDLAADVDEPVDGAPRVKRPEAYQCP